MRLVKLVLLRLCYSTLKGFWATVRRCKEEVSGSGRWRKAVYPKAYPASEKCENVGAPRFQAFLIEDSGGCLA